MPYDILWLHIASLGHNELSYNSKSFWSETIPSDSIADC